MDRFKKWFHNLSLVGKTSFIIVATMGSLFTVSALSTPSTNTTEINNSSTNTVTEQKPVITTKTETKTEEIPYSSKTVETSDLPKGQTKVQTAGVNGIKTITYTITLTDGVETDRTSKETITTSPIDEVTLSGTYVEPVQQSSNCDPNYSGCVPIASDVDCAGGSGNGPAYVYGPVRIIGSDIYDLDRDGDGWGCE